jgi:hypothetical protein
VRTRVSAEPVGEAAAQGCAGDADGSGDRGEGAHLGHGEMRDVGEVQDGHGGPQAAAGAVDEGDREHSAAVATSRYAFRPYGCAARRTHCSPLR